ncbi:single-stranded DNA-binding protein [Vaginella massiliensis]|uniref:single-stranded DNA-binding protein n=1 Tax=Vaginella massiliensis TaxID=1816680 RepID=UPI0008380AE1|nr:single-stranded DNA-binding protein [Vaginella massiliensis]
MQTLRNSVRLIGNVGNAPEVKVFENNKKLARFSIATNESYVNARGEKITNTQWHNLVVWDKLAEIVEKHLTKGKEVAVEGKLTYRDYEDAKGEKRNFTEIVVNELLLL